MNNTTDKIKDFVKRHARKRIQKRNQKFQKKTLSAVSRDQKENRPKAVLVIFVGGLGDFFVIIPSLKAIAEKYENVVLLGQEACGYTRLFNDNKHWFIDFIPLELLWKDLRRFSKLLGAYCFSEVYNIGPTGVLLVERIVEGLRFAKKYTLSSRYMRIENYPVPIEIRNQEANKYDFCLHGTDTQTHYDVQKAFAEQLGLDFPSAGTVFQFPRFHSDLVPKEPYFVLFLNDLNDPRDPSLGVLLDVIKHVVQKTGWDLVLLGGRDDHRSSVLSECVSPCSIHNLRGKTSIQDYIELVASAKLTICSDSSVAHIANAYGSDSVVFCSAMYGDALFPYQWGYGIEHQLVIQTDIPCHDCHRRYNGKAELPGCSQRYMCADMYSSLESIRLIDEKFFSAIPNN